ncbi:hypothetical protein G5B38_05165 [Pseudohalocynthiibacter aestuariivivens]|uniref:Uncharacterized protein n=1 Tax=Roseovarius pelagicus TaxID=2980108 RepID=A0ABY6DAE7_9RHOB|nr:MULTISPECIES: hypothetical protein [Rhodobacterales]QIE44964.1 hypothetical protein G5B38_05165 [Pseudohalocynthiibacter aestuariivivens]UXX83117.1 hypothetical protein N7U68_18895 [Roseovarius pelagicus]
MSEQSETTRNSGNGFLAFVVGGLVVAVGVMAWLLYGGGEANDDVNISIEGAAPAAEAVEDAVTGD